METTLLVALILAAWLWLNSVHARELAIEAGRRVAAAEGLQLLDGTPPERRSTLLEWAAFADFLVDRLPVLEQEWKDRREALRAAGDLPDSPDTQGPGQR